MKGLRYRSIGPAWGGRVSRVAGVPGDPRIYYAATASGGVWKSVNGGPTFPPVFDRQDVQTIGAIAIDPGNGRAHALLLVTLTGVQTGFVVNNLEKNHSYQFQIQVTNATNPGLPVVSNELTAKTLRYDLNLPLVRR